MYFPMFVEMEGKRVVVIGGGEEGFRKVRILESFGADVTVVAKEICFELREFADKSKKIILNEKEYETDDIIGADIAVAAVGDERLGKIIHEACVQRMIPVNIADNRKFCTFIFPAIHRDDPLIVAVSTGGAAPAEAARVRDLIKDALPGDISDHVREAGQIREDRRRKK